jgi:hypothetical protein
MAEAGKAYAKAHSLVKKHAADHLKGAKNPNQMVKHYLDSKHGRHLYGNENNAAYVKKDFGQFAKKYDAKMHEEVEQIEELSKQTLANYVNKAGDSRNAQGYNMAKADSVADKKKAINKDVNRMSGIAKATSRLAKEDIDSVEEAKKASFKDVMNKSAEKTKNKYKDWKPPHPVQDKTKVLRYSSDLKKEEVELSVEEIARIEEIAKGL